MTRVHVWGASGYGAAEGIRLLSRHPAVELGVLESASHAGEPVSAHFPLLRSSELVFAGRGAVAAALRDGDFVLMGGAHGSAVEQAPAFVAAGARVIDLSADFRDDTRAVYGLPERYAAAIAGAELVANPGCYPTASLLALLPLVGGGSLDYALRATLAMTEEATPRGGGRSTESARERTQPGGDEGMREVGAGPSTSLRYARDDRPVQIVIDAKSGITGAGRNPSTAALFAEVAGDIRAYGLGGHRHEPEIVRQLGAVSCDAPLVFTPHVVPLARGMLADCYAIYSSPQDAASVRAAYERAYAGNPFVRVLAEGVAPSVAAVVGTNDAEIAVSVHGNVVRAICAIDNLGKGAAGQAVQNLNIMLGLDQELGLNERVVVNQ
jgi:N-acetyl-gamma-glutamyl-phosphate reductase